MLLDNKFVISSLYTKCSCKAEIHFSFRIPGTNTIIALAFQKRKYTEECLKND